MTKTYKISILWKIICTEIKTAEGTSTSACIHIDSKTGTLNFSTIYQMKVSSKLSENEHETNVGRYKQYINLKVLQNSRTFEIDKYLSVSNSISYQKKTE